MSSNVSEIFAKEFGLEENVTGKRFSFVHLKKKKYNSLSDKDNQALLMKWSMKDQLRIQTYAFVEPYRPVLETQFIHNFFNDPINLNTLQGFPKLPPLNGTKPRNISISPVSCTISCMSFFDFLLDPENGVVRGEDHINKCMEEDVDGVLVADELRQMILNPESPRYELMPKAQRDEFIFKLFSHFVLGGQWCQYEDEIKPYLDITKAVYKDLISLQKKDYEELVITSKVFQIEVKDEKGTTVFPPKAHHKQNFAYFIVEPNKRELITLTHHFGGTFPVVP